MPGIDQRKHRRLTLSVPVTVRAPAAAPVETSTRDISATGISFTLDQSLAVGSELEWEVTLPPEVCGGKAVRMECRGRIVRVDHPGAGGLGIAAVLETYKLTTE